MEKLKIKTVALTKENWKWFDYMAAMAEVTHIVELVTVCVVYLLQMLLVIMF